MIEKHVTTFRRFLRLLAPEITLKESPIFILLFLVLKVVSYRQRRRVLTKPLYYSRLRLDDVRENSCYKQTTEQIFMDLYG